MARLCDVCNSWSSRCGIWPAECSILARFVGCSLENNFLSFEPNRWVAEKYSREEIIEKWKKYLAEHEDE